jgi:AraC family transcriptional regulator
LGVRLYAEYLQDDAASELAIEGLALELMAAMHRCQQSGEDRRHANWLKSVREMIHDRFRDNVSLCELAANANVHPVYLARAFRKHFHCTVGEYVRHLRITKACEELSTSKASMVDIADQNGFSDQSHLSRLIKQHTGMSPGAIRKKKTNAQCP